MSSIIQKSYQLFYKYFLSEKSSQSTVSDLNFNTNINININKLKHHKFSKGEIIHYGFLTSVLTFVFFLNPASFLIKLPIALLFITCFLIPLTSQFFIHALPIFTWLAFYFTSSKIPHSWKPAISVKVLPAMETILYGDNLSNVLATITNQLLDISAWLPYGIFHFGAPFVVAIVIFLFAPPTSLRSYGFAFGYMNLFGVFIQILFPAAPPWYKNLYGLKPANYSMKGSPGGLGRIDELLGINTYTQGFSNSPVIFGAFPSLHSGCCIMEVLFFCWLFPNFKILWCFYASWLWWSTMYLTHHYFVDLIGGAMLSLIVFEFVRYNYLPKIRSDKFCRWSYTKIEFININQINPLSNHYVSINDDENQFYTRLNYINPQQINQQSIPLQSLNQQQSQQQESFEMSNMPRARQISKPFDPLVINKRKEDEEEENISATSNTPSVFEEDGQQVYVNSSATSVDDLDLAMNNNPSSKQARA
ncbi:unnamed protein product [Candida verbasci]|uniref:Phosphatidic acid phosphatase type 2/haloperoxidase domain-containing protein n=1 Tax=Candida verbasci TaxID=1227364 RepID=A0A9W4XIA3_9ASCO|nr:unnamed protein product [Candida verbasci]